MNPLSIFVLVVAVVASSNAQNTEVTPSGSVDVNVNGAVIAGPSGSVRTDNGLSSQGAAAQLSGPGGDVHTKTGVLALNGASISHAGVPAFTAPNYLSAPAHSSRTILATSGVAPNILANPFIASHRVVAGPAYYSHPIVGASRYTPSVFSTHGIAPTFVGYEPRLGYGLGHGIHGLGF